MIGMVSVYEDPDLIKEQRIAEAEEQAFWIEPENETHWHRLRSGNINSTESPALFGLSPYNTRFELWHQKKGGQIVQIEDNTRMKWGRRLQDAIAYGVGEEQGWRVTPLREYAYVPAMRMGSSFDFQAYCEKRGTGILEIKNVDYSIYKRQWLDDEAPDHIEVQLQHQLEVTGFGWGCIAALVGGNNLKLIIRERDKEMGKAIQAEVHAFWQSIANSVPPDPDFSQDAEIISRLYSKSGGGQITSDNPRLEFLAKTYMQAAQDEKVSEALREAAAAEIKTIIGNADAVFVSGLKISAKAIVDNPGITITPEMVGQVINARRGYRPIRITQIKEKQ